MKIEKINHVVVGVKNLDTAIPLFAALFGTTFDDLGVVEEMGIHSVISPEGIELVMPLSEDNPLAKFIATHGEGLFAVGFKVANADAAAADAKALGVRQLAKIQKPKLGHTFRNLTEIMLHPKDCGGVLTLLAEYEPPEEGEV